MVWYQGREYKKLKEHDNRIVVEDKDGNFLVLDKNVVYDTKKESLSNWIPFSLHDVQLFHYLKFGKQDDALALRKVVEEIHELEDAIATLSDYTSANGFDKEDSMVTFLLNRCADEYSDVIQAGSCLFGLVTAMRCNFNKVGKRDYSDGYSHDEDY